MTIITNADLTHLFSSLPAALFVGVLGMVIVAGVNAWLTSPQRKAWLDKLEKEEL
jgi:antibiotic biosynthesis monooxygenase (ABM) superfamily enzyme